NADNAHLAEDEKLLFRIGIAIGDVLVAEKGDLLGDAVNVAARLENLAEPGGICISDDVRSHVQNKIPLNVVDLGGRTLHNIAKGDPGVPHGGFATSVSVTGRNSQAARSRVVLTTTVAIEASAQAAMKKKISRTRPWSSNWPKMIGDTMPAMLKPDETNPNTRP